MNALAVDIPVIETERLRLRGPSLDDLDAETAFYATERSEFVGGPKTRNEVWRLLAALMGHWVFRGYGFWGVEEKATGAYCGRVGLWCPLEWPEPEIGWSLMDGFEGRGYAQEAALAARAHAYGTLGWTTAISLIDRENTRSKALATRIGARFESIYTHPTHGDCELWRHPGPEAAA